MLNLRYCCLGRGEYLLAQLCSANWHKVSFLQEHTLLTLTIPCGYTVWWESLSVYGQMKCLWKKRHARQYTVSMNYNLLWMSSHHLLSLRLYNKHSSSPTRLAIGNQTKSISFNWSRKAAKKNISEGKRQTWQKGSDTGSRVFICTHNSKFHILHILKGDGLYLLGLSHICAKCFTACTDSEDIFAFVLPPSSPSPPEHNYYLVHRKWSFGQAGCAL